MSESVYLVLFLQYIVKLQLNNHHLLRQFMVLVSAAGAHAKNRYITDLRQRLTLNTFGLTCNEALKLLCLDVRQIEHDCQGKYI